MTPRKPTTVAAMRGLLWALAAAVVTAFIALTPADLAGFGPWAPVLAILLPLVGRALEGAVLDRHQPPQAGLLGGQPAQFYDWPIDEPAAYSSEEQL